jgi:hypothetical protein
VLSDKPGAEKRKGADLWLFFSCLHLHATPFAHPVWVRYRVGEGGGVEVQTAEKQPQIRTLSLFRSRFIREHKTSRRAAKEAKGVK